ncbi:MAG TPA: response regulator transcription factor [Spirochaetia bacterium]|nr:response regulator transcription factor [Spirochaetia bacterium]
MNELVAIVEDEDDIRALVAAALKKERFRVREHPDGKGFLASLPADKPNLVILDVMLPDTDGFEICRRMRADRSLSAIPVIILTARAEEPDRILGLELGADDYVVKPFSPKELAVRVKAVLRRASPEAARARIDAGDGLVIDTDTVEAFVGEERLELTQAEFRILQLLASRVGWVFSREKILDHLWGNEKNVTDRSVDVHVKHLRDKLGGQGGRIVNVRGIGYKLVASHAIATEGQ